MVSAEISCTPPAIPAPCSKPPTITRMYFVRRLIAVSSSRLGTFRHVDSRHRFILCSCCDGLSRATTLWAKHAGAHRNRTPREQEAKIRACFLIYVFFQELHGPIRCRRGSYNRALFVFDRAGERPQTASTSRNVRCDSS